MNRDRKWSEGAWDAAREVYNGILTLPFLREMALGTLPTDKFTYYIGQDSLYIDIYSRVLARIASQMPDEEGLTAFLQFALDGVEVEKTLHAVYVHERPAVMSDACAYYSSFLKACAGEGVEVGAAAILPCFWIYQKVGEHILHTAQLDGNPYADWIRCYGDPAFDASTRRCIAICDRLASSATEATRRRMTEVYIRCSRLEYIFWDSAYHKGNYKI